MRDGTPDLDAIDVGDLFGVGEFQGRGRHLEDDDSRSPVAVVRLEFAQTDDVSVEGEGGIQILGLEHEPQLPDAVGGCAVI